MMQSEKESESLSLLRSIEQKLAKQNFEFDALDDHEKQIYVAAAIRNTSLAHVYEIEETTPELVEARRQREEASQRKTAEYAQSIGAVDGEKIRQLAAQVSRSAFDKSKGNFGP